MLAAAAERPFHGLPDDSSPAASCWPIHPPNPSLASFSAPSQAILSKQRAETLSSVLYPDDRTYEGKELRLKQQHFFVSATVQVRASGAMAAGWMRAAGVAGQKLWGQAACAGIPRHAAPVHTMPQPSRRPLSTSHRVFFAHTCM